jgi:hypothetical protein
MGNFQLAVVFSFSAGSSKHAADGSLAKYVIETCIDPALILPHSIRLIS